MSLLLDTSLWIDFSRSRSHAALQQFIAPYVLDPEAHLAETVRFEVLRCDPPGRRKPGCRRPSSPPCRRLGCSAFSAPADTHHDQY